MTTEKTKESATKTEPLLAPDKKLHLIFSAIGAIVLTIVGIIFWEIVLAIGISLLIAIIGSAGALYFKKNIFLVSLVTSFIGSEVVWIVKEMWDAGWVLQWVKVKDPLTGFGWVDLGADQIGIAIGLAAMAGFLFLFCKKKSA